MANYTQTNIYRRQMNELGLNTKQYAKLIDMPYEVVKDMIYDKEGDYSMEIGKILRNNMFNKHQDIENNFDNAKYEAMRIKKEDDEIDYLDWYYREYSPDMLKSKLNVSSITDFERKFCLVVNEKRASHWFYTILCGKREYDGHGIENDKKTQFVSQLYDILINGNIDNYKEGTPLENVRTPQQKKSKAFYHNWYRTFDCKKFVKEHHISNSTLERELGFSPAVISRLINKRRFSDNALVRLYDYVCRTTNNIDYFNWFKDFDLKEYMAQHNLTNSTLGMKIGLGIVSTSQLANKRFYTKKTLEKLYKYIKENETNDKEETIKELSNEKRKAIISSDTQKINELNNKILDKVVEVENEEYSKEDEIEVLDDEQDDNNTAVLFERKDEINDEIEALDTIDALQDNSTSDKVDISTRQIEIEHDNNAILRMILVNRLTDEEKLLIELFGGKIC